MLKLPKTIRFFKKPDHIAFLIGYSIILISLPLEFLELKVGGIICFTFTLCYEIFEISKGNRDIVKIDHITFVIAYAMLLITLWYNYSTLTILSLALFGFTLAYEIYTVRKKDLENLRRRK